MSNDLNPMAVIEAEREILRLSRRLTRITEEIAEAAVIAARADVDYKLEHAKAILRASGTVAEKEAKATLDCEPELMEAKRSEASYRALQEVGRNIRSQLDALRSINANARAATAWVEGRGG